MSIPNNNGRGFEWLCAERGPPGETHASICKIQENECDDVRASVGKSTRLCNLYSSTKSLVGLTIAHDVYYHGFDATQDVRPYLPVRPDVRARLTRPVPLYALLNHTAGISHICFSDPGVVADLLTRRRNTQAVIESYLEELEGPGAPFSYSPVLGYMVAGMVYELIKRRETGDARFSIKRQCSRLFFPAEMDKWEWAECDGVGLCRHTFAFSEFKTTGRGMQQLGRNLLTRHRELLLFILSPKLPAGLYVRHARSSRAGGAGAGTGGGGEVAVDYDYSFGWWLLPAAGILTTIGLGGQYIVLDTRQNVVGTRQQATLFNTYRQQWVKDEIRAKRRGFVLSTHETFPLLVRDYFESGGAVDSDLERLLLFAPGEFELAETVTKDIMSGRRTPWAEAVLRGGYFEQEETEMTEFEVEDAVLRTLVRMKRAGSLLGDWNRAIEEWVGKMPLDGGAGWKSMGIFSIYFAWIVSSKIK